MFDNQEINLFSEDKVLKVGDIVEVITENILGDELIFRGIIDYDSAMCGFVLDIPNKGKSVAICDLLKDEYIEFTYLGRDDEGLGCDNPLFKDFYKD
jgi:hypothetical protein